MVCELEADRDAMRALAEAALEKLAKLERVEVEHRDQIAQWQNAHLNAEARAERLREALEKVMPLLRLYASTHPKWICGVAEQDPSGVHALLLEVAALAAPSTRCARSGPSVAQPAVPEEEPRAPGRCELPYPVRAKDRREFGERHGEVK
jgi:hypothetical protein